MIISPGIIALITGSLLAAGFTLYGSFVGLQIIWRWDLSSGDELQLEFERRTYLVSTVLTYVMAFEIFGLFLFVYTADHIHPLFVGAMCAAGSLNVNPYGYPTLVAKLISVLFCGAWLIVNHTDNQAPDYPLIRFKYKFVLVIAALLLVESLLQINYFRDMSTNVLTTCCGTLFNEDAPTLGGGAAALPPVLTQIVFFLSLAVLIRIGLGFVLTRKAARAFSFMSNWLFLVSLVSVIVFISVYYYELPTHHCPFDLLQKEYHYIGYPLYACLLAAGISGTGVGLLDRFRQRTSLSEIIPVTQRKLCFFSMAGYICFAALSVYPMIFSDFKLTGY